MLLATGTGCGGALDRALVGPGGARARVQLEPVDLDRWLVTFLADELRPADEGRPGATGYELWLLPRDGDEGAVCVPLEVLADARRGQATTTTAAASFALRVHASVGHACDGREGALLFEAALP